MSSKILKHNIINSFKTNLNENNIEDVIFEIKRKTNLNFSIKLMMKGYKLFEAFTQIVSENIKCYGFGRNKYEALSHCLLNLIECILDKENLVEPLNESLKVLSSNNVDQKEGKIINDDDEEELKVLVELMNNDSSHKICNTSNFSIIPINTDKASIRLKEKDLIINETLNIIDEIISQLKSIEEKMKTDEIIPDCFICPISMQKFENPVISSEGHSFEKWAIEKWLITNNTSPITGLKLTNNILISNYALKSAYEEVNKRIVRVKRIRKEIQKFITKSEFDVNDIKKFII